MKVVIRDMMLMLHPRLARQHCGAEPPIKSEDRPRYAQCQYLTSRSSDVGTAIHYASTGHNVAAAQANAIHYASTGHRVSAA
eukprot:653939-Rhodomonas_salina.1